MATLGPIDKMIGAYSTASPNAAGRQFIQWSLDFRRALIFFDKGYIPRGPVDPDHEEHLQTQELKSMLSDPTTYTPVNESTLKSANNQKIDDGVYLIIKEAWGNYKPGHSIAFPFIPKELNWQSESSFGAIKPIGRNTSRYHFTGSEDRLEFEIDWHSFDQGRQDVIQNCRLVESLSKSDAYEKSPPIVLLKWGNEDHLFEDMEFIVTSASYKLTQFNKAQQINKQTQRTHMMPIQAYQRVTLARVSSTNLTTKDIQYVSKF